MEKLRVLVVDDSVFMRKTIAKIITCDTIEVVETAVNGKDAIEKIRALKPDVVTLDIEMPIMNGLDALKVIMDEFPLPVIMVSTLTGEGADATIEAFSLGAVDFVTKKSAFTEMYSLQDELIEKISNVGFNKTLRAQFKRKGMLSQKKREQSNGDTPATVSSQSIAQKLAEKSRQKKAEPTYTGTRRRPKSSDVQCIVIGISTGGPVALLELFKHLPALPVPILIAQHMPPFFTKSLAERLNGLSQVKIKEAEDGEKVAPGCAYFAPGGKQMTINKRLVLNISDEPKDELYKPSVNILVKSVTDVYGKNSIGIIMTGMGHDGRDSLRHLHSIGGYVISQDVDSCVVAGMPRSVIEAGIADEIIPLNDIAAAVSSIFGQSAV